MGSGEPYLNNERFLNDSYSTWWWVYNLGRADGELKSWVEKITGNTVHSEFRRIMLEPVAVLFDPPIVVLRYDHNKWCLWAQATYYRLYDAALYVVLLQTEILNLSFLPYSLYPYFMNSSRTRPFLSTLVSTTITRHLNKHSNPKRELCIWKPDSNILQTAIVYGLFNNKISQETI